MEVPGLQGSEADSAPRLGRTNAPSTPVCPSGTDADCTPMYYEVSDKSSPFNSSLKSNKSSGQRWGPITEADALPLPLDPGYSLLNWTAANPENQGCFRQAAGQTFGEI